MKCEKCYLNSLTRIFEKRKQLFEKFDQIFEKREQLFEMWDRLFKMRKAFNEGKKQSHISNNQSHISNNQSQISNNQSHISKWPAIAFLNFVTNFVFLCKCLDESAIGDLEMWDLLFELWDLMTSKTRTLLNFIKNPIFMPKFLPGDVKIASRRRQTQIYEEPRSWDPCVSACMIQGVS